MIVETIILIKSYKMNSYSHLKTKFKNDYDWPAAVFRALYPFMNLDPTRYRIPNSERSFPPAMSIENWTPPMELHRREAQSELVSHD